MGDIGVPARTRTATRLGHQLRRHPQDPLTARDQAPLERPRHVPAVLKRPHSLALKAPRPHQQTREPASADRNRLLTQPLARRRSHRRRSCASARGCPHRARSLTRPPFNSTMVDLPRTRPARGALPRSNHVTPDIPDRRRATQQKQVGPPRPTASRQSTRRPVGTTSSASDITDTRIQTASLKAEARSGRHRSAAPRPGEQRPSAARTSMWGRLASS